jgi:glycosyltransferase involved in cell wall biosynthesis
MTEYKFYNQKAEFLSALKIVCDTQPREFRIFGTHQNAPTDWTEVAYDLARNQESTLLTLKIPVNYACFLIQITGKPIQFHNISSGTLIPRTDSQIREKLRRSSVAILCCARNCEHDIDNSLKQLSFVANLFEKYQIYVIENDSTDLTLEALNESAEKNRIKLKLFTTQGLDNIFELRTERLSYCRNYLLKVSQEFVYDYYIVADVDGIYKSIDTERFMTCFKFECWAGCFPVSSQKYYDLWALRHPTLMPGDYDHRLNQIPYVLANDNAQRLVTVPIRNIDFSQTKGWLEVDSAFGGFGLYAGHYFRGGRYHGRENGNQICEHVTFHKKLQLEGGRFYINPEFIMR